MLYNHCNHHRPDGLPAFQGTLLHADLNGYLKVIRSPLELDCTVWWHNLNITLDWFFSSSPIRIMVTGGTGICSMQHLLLHHLGLRHWPEFQFHRSDLSSQITWIWTDQYPPADRSGADGATVNDRHTSIPAWLSSSGEAMPLSIT